MIFGLILTLLTKPVHKSYTDAKEIALAVSPSPYLTLPSFRSFISSASILRSSLLQHALLSNCQPSFSIFSARLTICCCIWLSNTTSGDTVRLRFPPSVRLIVRDPSARTSVASCPVIIHCVEIFLTSF